MIYTLNYTGIDRNGYNILLNSTVGIYLFHPVKNPYEFNINALHTGRKVKYVIKEIMFTVIYKQHSENYYSPFKLNTSFNFP